MREIPDPGFAGDDGAADPAVTAALAAYAERPAAFPETLAALQGSRVLVPVVAVLGEAEVGESGLAREKDSDMATVLVTGADGRRALLAFTGSASLARWNPEARPVPVTIRTAAKAAIQEGAAALVVDLAGPVQLTIVGEDLRGVAEGWRPGRVDGVAVWIRPATS